ncbi:MAG: pyridoxal 5'-phosphate synthase glutaminase subunit PdxT [Fimbriimonadaceae bacterium]|jgi:5'-phosphate synthase pdxT subunit|nr:pyridoxal 5'-phosphate synthase glutaminase subunit PdxT [Fimbriimonadaceae bacterium]
MSSLVGVAAVQGDFVKHIEALQRCGAAAVEVRSPEDLATVDGLIIPGGESTTVGLLMERYGLGAAIRERAGQGMPIWGTCMGMILLAREIEDKEQYRLNLLDITVRRNAFGAQVNSFEDEVSMPSLGIQVVGVFIRAPIVTRLGEGVEELARYGDHVVAVRQGSIMGTSFHPELTEDTRLHELFLSWVRERS